MKRIYLSILALIGLLLFGNSWMASAQQYTFGYTGGVQTLTVPAGVFSITVDLRGAQGGSAASAGPGGLGGRLQAQLSVTPGQVLNIYVGGQGQGNTGGTDLGGFNGGGTGYAHGGGGGGETDVRIGGTAFSNVIAIAGGGGGGGYYPYSTPNSGGAGGGNNGLSGMAFGGTYEPGYLGGGGTQTSGGAGGSYGGGQNGSQGTGGNASTSYYNGYGPGGGGAGWYGGGGAYDLGGGGGGSSWPIAVGIEPNGTQVIAAIGTTPGFNSGAGQANIGFVCTPPTPGSITGPTGVCLPLSGFNAIQLGYSGSTGGNWYSLNPGVAAVSNTGVVTTVSAGVATISYSLVYSCGTVSGTTNVTVYPTPSPIFPLNPTVCSGSSMALNNSDANGTWSSSTTTIATVGTQSPSSAGINGVAGGNSVISYTESDGCITTTTLLVNPSPFSISGTPTVCSGSTTSLSDATSGGVWTSATTSVASVGSTTGLVTGGAVASSTNVNVSYTIPATGCAAVIPITVNPVPTSSYVVSAVASGYCPGGSGVAIHLSNNQATASYQLIYNGVTNVGTPVAGSGIGVLNFGPQYAGGNYTVQGINNTTGCTSMMSGVATFSVYPNPTVHNLTAASGGVFCSDACGVDLMLDSTQEGYGYQLYESGVGMIGSAFYNFSDPTDGGIDFQGYLGALIGNPACGLGSPGQYYVVAYNISTGCQDTMNNRPTVVMNTIPVVHNVTVENGGNFCAGSAGAHVGLDYSDVGINYQLWLNGVTLVITKPGTNAALDFGPQNVSGGAYTVTAVNAITGCTNVMTGSAMLNANMLPTQYPVGGGGARCYGGAAVDVNMTFNDGGTNYQLYRNDTAIGSLVSGSGLGTLDMGSWYAAGNYTVVGINAVTGCTNLMLGSAMITVQNLPTVETVTGGGNLCINDYSGKVVGLANSQTGISYELMLLGSTVGEISGGTGAINFAPQLAGGFYTVVAIDSSTPLYCSSVMGGGATINIDPLPTIDTVMGGGAFCFGTPGVHVELNFSLLGVQYQLYNRGSMVGTPVNGTNSGIDFGAISDSGAYWVAAKNATTGCKDTMAGTAPISINGLPQAYPVTNGGSYCAGGTGAPVGLGGSSIGISYQLYVGGSMTGTPMTGTGTSINFGNQTTPGTYTIVATNIATGCTSAMTGSQAVAVNALPTPYSVTGGGDICAGATGVHVGLGSSNTGVSYDLMTSGGTLLSTKAGTGSAIDFGVYAAAGNYVVTASNVTTLCSNNMSGAANIVINPLPTAYNVTGGGDYCAGGTGLHVGLANSNTGISYQLYNGSSAWGVPVTGFSGMPIDFGTETTGGTYTIMATNSITGCVANMTGSKMITVNPLPGTYTVTGGGSLCAGGAGVNVGLSGSATDINYTLMNGYTGVATLLGTGGALSFGHQNVSGNYTVVATNPATGCSANMSSGAMVVINPLPDQYAVTGGGSFCAGGTGVHVGVIGSGYGVNYQLMNGSTGVGLPVGGTGSAVDLGLQTGAGTYNVVATNVLTGCSSNMTGTATITVIPTVTPGVTMTSNVGGTVCEGTAATFTASATNGGGSPIFTWSVGGVVGGSGSSYTYVPANGDLVTVQMTSNATCATPATVSTSMHMNTLNWVLPAASVTANPGTTVCSGTPITFTAATMNGGSAPYGTWILNSGYTGVTSNTYTYTPSNGDVVLFMLLSNAQCRSLDTVYSGTMVIGIDTPVVPAVTMSAHLGPVIGVGQVDTIRALVSNGGTSLLNYQWYVDGNLVHNNNTDRLVMDNAFNGDTVVCTVSASNECGGGSTTVGTRVYLKNLGVTNVSGGESSIRVVPNPNNGEFTVSGTLGNMSNSDVTMEVTNMVGQTVYTGVAHSNAGAISATIQLNSGIANGMYLLTVHSGSEVMVFHFVVEQ